MENQNSLFELELARGAKTIPATRENLTVKGIREVTGKVEKQARAVFNHWEELYPAVIRCRDTVRKNNVKQSDKEMTSNDKN